MAGGRGAGEGRSSKAGAAAAAQRVCGGCCGRPRHLAPLRDRGLGWHRELGPPGALNSTSSGSSCRSTANGSELPLVREPGPGRQVGPRYARRASGKRPDAGWAVAASRDLTASGAKGRAPTEAVQPWEHRVRGVGEVRAKLQDQRLQAQDRSVTSDEQEFVPRHRLWVVCCACALFLPVAPSERAPFPCVLTRTRAAF